MFTPVKRGTTPVPTPVCRFFSFLVLQYVYEGGGGCKCPRSHVSRLGPVGAVRALHLTRVHRPAGCESR